MNIRTTKSSKGAIMYNASDICQAIGKRWNGKATLSLPSLKNGKDFELVSAPLQVSGNSVVTVKHYAISASGVTKLCKKHKVENPLASVVTLNSPNTAILNKKVADLETEMKELKGLLSVLMHKSVTEAKPAESPAQPKGEAGGSEGSVQESVERATIRALCTNFAKKLAKDFGNEGKDLGTYHDITYTLLYSRYKSKTNFDIKKEAEDQNKTGLQIAQDYGILGDLLKFTKELFNSKLTA